MRLDSKILSYASKTLLSGVAGLVVTAMPTHAQPYLSGTYNCVRVEVAGKTTPCSAPSIEMNSDGS